MSISWLTPKTMHPLSFSLSTMLLPLPPSLSPSPGLPRWPGYHSLRVEHLTVTQTTSPPPPLKQKQINETREGSWRYACRVNFSAEKIRTHAQRRDGDWNGLRDGKNLAVQRIRNANEWAERLRKVHPRWNGMRNGKLRDELEPILAVTASGQRSAIPPHRGAPSHLARNFCSGFAHRVGFKHIRVME